MDKILALKEEGKSLREIARELGISHMTVARILRNAVTGSNVTPKAVTEEDVTVDVTPDVTDAEKDVTVDVTATPKLEVRYKRTDPEVAPYLHLFPEDVEFFSFHVPGSPPLGARDFRKVIAQKGIDNTRWEDVYFVPEGYVWPKGTRSC